MDVLREFNRNADFINDFILQNGKRPSLFHININIRNCMYVHGHVLSTVLPPISICMCVCMYVCMHACMYVCTLTCTLYSSPTNLNYYHVQLN